MNLFSRIACLGVCLFLAEGAFPSGASNDGAADKKETAVDKTQNKAKKSVQQIIFEEQKIEGKIRRPQMVLIKADERPVFSSMVLSNIGRNDNIADFVDRSIIEKTPNQGAFQFEGTHISNYVK